MSSQRDTPARTRAPALGIPVVLYDGDCAFCTREALRLKRRCRGRVVAESFQDDGVLEKYPGITHDSCMEEIKLVDRDGAVYGGAEAVVRSMITGKSAAGRLASLYFLPVVRPIADRLYAFIARRRYRLAPPTACGDGPCARHSH